jgi:hypothetical protein
MVSSGGGGGARHGVVAAWASFFSSRIGLDCQVRWFDLLLLVSISSNICGADLGALLAGLMRRLILLAINFRYIWLTTYAVMLVHLEIIWDSGLGCI